MVFQDVWAGIWTEETHHSTALEGNTLRQRQVRLLLENGVVSGQITFRELLEARAYGNAARWVYEHAFASLYTREAMISEAIVREIHKLVVGPVWPEFRPTALYAVRSQARTALRITIHFGRA